MRIHTIIHAPFEEAGVIETWAMNKGHELSSTHTYKGEKLPEHSTIDFLVIMGGPQGFAELDKYPYLRDELDYTRQAIQQQKVVLGVCLGAQIISESLGAKTEPSPNKEIGVYPVKLTKEGENDPVFEKLPKSFDVMHWHNDMPGIPQGSMLLAYSEGCPRQVIKYSERVYGLQCHMELTKDLLKGLVAHCQDDLQPGKYVQESEKLLVNDMTQMNIKMIIILDHLAALVR